MKANTEGNVWGGMEVKGNSNNFCTMIKVCVIAVMV